YFAAIFGALRYNMTRTGIAMIDKQVPCSVWGLQGATFAGGANVDSYDSTVSPYNPATPGTDANVCSCRNVTLVGSPTTIYGEALYGSGYSFSVSGQAEATQGSEVLPACPNDPVTDMTYVSTHNNNAAVGYASGAALRLNGHATLTLPAGDYYFS